jgi:hypothetical protein
MALTINWVKRMYDPGIIDDDSDEDNENGFARAFGGAGGKCEWGGMPPQTPPSVGDVTGIHLTSFLS